MSGAIGAASIGRTNCASDLAFAAAAKGDDERARKDNSSWAVTRPAELHVAPASLLFGSMPGAAESSVDVRTGSVEWVGERKVVL
jgi:hypothetical protein